MKQCKYLLKLSTDKLQKTWEVRLCDGGYNLGERDWMMFIKENGIKAGNICVFELIHTHQNVFEVTILGSTT